MLADYLNQSADLLRETARTLDDDRMARAIALTVTALGANRPLLVCGNGGSAADAMHITGELVGRFLRDRRALKAICLAADSAVLTAWSNDFGYDTVFARQVQAYGEPGGVLLAISTSGNSANVIKALEAARAGGMASIGLTGQGGGKMAGLCDILLDAPSRSTPMIQQVHGCLYHYFCEKVEAALAH